MTITLGPDWFSADPTVLRALYEAEVRGTRISNWSKLAAGSRTALAAAAQHTSQLYDSWQRSADDEPADTYLLLAALNPGAVGHLLSSVLCAAAATESFVWFVAAQAVDAEGALDRSFELMRQFAVTNQRTPSASEVTHLMSGYSEAATELKRLDRETAMGRIRAVLELINVPAVESDLKAGLQALIRFRNDLVHDSPLVFGPNGTMFGRRRDGTPERYDPSSKYLGMYPSLHEGPLALRPSHALAAAQSHDQLVAHVRKNCSASLASAISAQADFGYLPILIEVSPWSMHVPATRIRELAEAWDRDVVPWFQNVSMSELEDTYLDLARKLNVRSVD